MAMKYEIVSADSHVNPLPTFWEEYLPEAFKEQAPKLERTKDGDFVTFEGSRSAFGILGALAGIEYKDYKTTGSLDDVRPGGWLPEPRIEDLEMDGVDAEVLYGGGPLSTSDPKLHLASYRAYNDWLADFCSYSPERLLGIAYVPMVDVQEAIDILKRAHGKGLKGVVIAAFPPSKDAKMMSGGLALTGDSTRSYADPQFEPFWEATIELGMPLHMHLGARSSQAYGQDTFMANMVMTKLTMAEPIANFIFSGLLQKYPELKLVSVESGVGWMAFAIEYMDHLFKRHKFWTKSSLTELPSFYFHRQILATFLHDPTGVREREAIGVNNIMWSSDYPHSETTWPHSKQSIAEHFAGVSAEDTYRMICGNATDLYGMNGR